MHIHFLDPYKPRPSLVHEFDPRIKFVLTVAFILTTALTPPAAWPVYILLLAVVLAVAMLSELGLPYVLKRSLIAIPFVLAALPIIFTLEGPTLLSFDLGPWTISLSQTGLERFISIALKSWISVQAAIILAASTPFPEILQAMRAVKMPRLLVAIFGLMWRYLFVLADEALLAALVALVKALSIALSVGKLVPMPLAKSVLTRVTLASLLVKVLPSAADTSPVSSTSSSTRESH